MVKTEPRRYRVYVLELDKSVWDVPRFRKANPDYREGKPMVYVGSTGVTVDERLAEHLADERKRALVPKYFRRKRPDAYRNIRSRASRDAAEKREARLAADLRARGWGVWQK